MQHLLLESYVCKIVDIRINNINNADNIKNDDFILCYKDTAFTFADQKSIHLTKNILCDKQMDISDNYLIVMICGRIVDIDTGVNAMSHLMISISKNNEVTNQEWNLGDISEIDYGQATLDKINEKSRYCADHYKKCNTAIYNRR